ncbi:MAG: hypothetical protein RQ748_05710, partial [Elusimicrobiales bacterium]|nr:hypothetical protein [Elusimicrobiales bacterium]
FAEQLGKEKLMKTMKTSVLIGLVCFFAGNPCFAEDNSQNATIPSAEFVSENSKYIVTVAYEKFGGYGKATYSIRNNKGLNLGTFVADMSPRVVYVSNAGDRLVSFGGNWTEEEFLNRMSIYDYKGNVIANYRSKRPLLIRGPIALSNSGDVFALGVLHNLQEYVNSGIIKNEKVIVLFDFATGKILKQIPFAQGKYFRDIAISDDAEWIAVSFPVSYDEDNLVMMDKAGKIKWSHSYKGMLRVKRMSSDGKEFDLEEIAVKRGGPDKTVKKYENLQGNIRPQKQRGN